MAGVRTSTASTPGEPDERPFEGHRPSHEWVARGEWRRTTEGKRPGAGVLRRRALGGRAVGRSTPHHPDVGLADCFGLGGFTPGRRGHIDRVIGARATPPSRSVRIRSHSVVIRPRYRTRRSRKSRSRKSQSCRRRSPKSRSRRRRSRNSRSRRRQSPNSRSRRRRSRKSRSRRRQSRNSRSRRRQSPKSRSRRRRSRQQPVVLEPTPPHATVDHSAPHELQAAPVDAAWLVEPEARDRSDPFVAGGRTPASSSCCSVWPRSWLSS